ncbi:MAG TPA: AraC family transcriptional regulator [Bacteroidales bacterium]|nr:AraC family transcriptional regulator [Bacteroidales bacterium]
MLREQTHTYYEQKAELLLQYIANHLDGDLSVKTLSDISGISLFHFHRVMKAALGETLGSYIDRVRLDTAVKLIRYGDISFTDIALRIGFKDLSAFSKAFTKEFGISPNDFKADKNAVLNTHIDYKMTGTQKLVVDVKPKIKTLPDRMVYYIRVKGIYGGLEVIKAWDELGDFIVMNKLDGWNLNLFSVYYDDGDVVGVENTISDVCIASKKMVSVSGRIAVQNIPGGKYAVYRYKGPYDYLWDVYDAIFRDGVYPGDFKLRDAPIVEKYLNLSHKVKPVNLLTEIFIPIE